MIRKILISLILLSFSFISIACITVDPPQMTYQDLKVKNINLKEVEIEFIFQAKNPNAFELKASSYEYKLLIEDKKIIKSREAGFTLPPQKITEVKFPLTLEFKTVFETTAKLMGYILTGKKSLPYEIKGKLYLEAFNLSVPVNFNQTGEIPLPKI